MKQNIGYLRSVLLTWSGVLLFLTLLFPFSLTLQAQEFRSTLSGRVTDPSGAVVVNATVKAVEVNSKTTYTAQTTKDGTYYIP